MPVSIVLCRPGGTPVDLVKAGWSAVRYSTVVSGGFGSAVLVAPGDVRRSVPKLSVVRMLNDDRMVWEGTTEDVEFAWDQQSQSTTVTLFGKQRLLQLASVNRMWSLRALQLQASPPPTTVPLSDPGTIVRSGFLDASKPTLRGIGIYGNGNCTAGQNSGGTLVVPAGSTPRALLGTLVAGAGPLTFRSLIGALDLNGATLAGLSTIYPLGDFNFDVSAIASTIVSFALIGQTITTAAHDQTDALYYSNLRLLGTTLAEDSSGGYYAATLLRDVLSLVPGITAGQIDQGIEFVIQQLDRSTRTSVRSVIDEIASYFTREWSIWDDGRFDWKDPNLSEPGWTITLGDTISGRIKESVDGLARDTYLTYVDPTDQRQKEATATTTRLGNAFYRNGLKSDDIEAPGLAFTPTTAALYARAANDRLSRIPAAQGNVVVPAWKMLPRSNGGAAPAVEIRAGENITIPDMPVDDAFSGGADNMSLFHVVQSDVDLSAGTVTLTVAGYLPGLDVLTARLNAVTKVATS